VAEHQSQLVSQNYTHRYKPLRYDDVSVKSGFISVVGETNFTVSD